MKRRLFTAIFAILGIVLLILDSSTAIAGAQDGIKLCLMTVIPSLFPFFVLSVLLTGAMGGFRSPLLKPIGRLCGIPEGAEILLLTGLLGGYPVGAQAVATVWKNGQITMTDARRLLGFCSNAGPSFFFGIVAAQFGSVTIGLVLWLIHVISALAVGALLPGKSTRTAAVEKVAAADINTALRRSLSITANVCGWIVLFRIVIAYLSKIVAGRLPECVYILLFGVLELANGCCMLPAVDNIALRLIIAAFMLGLGGICVCTQTASVTGGLGLGMYLPGKLLQSLISAFLAALIAPLFYPLTGIAVINALWMLPAIFCILALLKKSVAFQRVMVYN